MKHILASVLVLLAISACSNSKSLPGGFELLKWEDGQTFYLTGPGRTNQDGGGTIQGTVLELAWNGEVIAAKRYATFRGNPDGWMIINTMTKQVFGPVSDEQFSTIKAKHRLQVRSALEAWEAL